MDNQTFYGRVELQNQELRWVHFSCPSRSIWNAVTERPGPGTPGRVVDQLLHRFLHVDSLLGLQEDRYFAG